jgi:2-polyprenyl-3-methyl-5-hydroxy-6-metoxy-1,4-benzoquinol methylase
LGLPIHGKTVLELGAGVGDHTTFFTDRGCRVVSVEPRPENCELFRHAMRVLGISEPEQVRVIQSAVEAIGELRDARFDIVYAYGILYHLADPEAALKLMAERCAGFLLLETCVSFGDSLAVNPMPEIAGQASQSIAGLGCRPTRAWIWAQLGALFPYRYVPATQPAHPEFPVDWAAPWPEDRLSRAVFVASRYPLGMATLLDRLPPRQEAA